MASEDLTQIQGVEGRRAAQEQSLDRLRPPSEIPGYEIEHLLGEGAYGQVWVGTDRNTGRRVAIKFYTHRGGVDWSLLHREVEKLKLFSTDRYVVQLMQVGWDADPPYFVMEYLERGSLEDLLRDGPLPLSEAVTIFREVAVGLVHTHGRGVLHCDLKPANVLLDQDNQPRLADFGQSRLTTEQLPAAGTLFYMAPEQADPNAAPDARWDVYALGALLFRMIVGHPPHRSPEVSRELEKPESLESRLSRYRHIIRQAPPPTEHRKVEGIDRSLIEIIDRCLAASPGKRFPNPQSVVDALNLRQMRRARRPLLVLGAVGPAMLMLVVGLMSYMAFDKAIEDTTGALVTRALESNRFAARFVAETAARDIDRRWRILETERVELRPLLEEVTAVIDDMDPDADGEWPPEFFEAVAPLQEWIEQRHAEHAHGTPASSWFICDSRGHQIARSPLAPTIGTNFAHREYFHGRGFEFDAVTDAEVVKTLGSIQDIHLSAVFESQANFNRMVAFSVPVRAKSESSQPGRILGLLAMTVELGSFGEMQSQDAPAGSRQQQAILVDMRIDWTGHYGLILQHPHLAKLREAEDAAGQRDEPLPAVHLNDTQQNRANELIAEPDDSPDILFLDNDYHDEMARVAAEYDDRWLAALEPVLIDGRSGGSRNVGWMAIVQERYREATDPVRALRSSLVWRGLLAAGLIAVIITGLWAFVVRLLNDTSRRGWLGGFRVQAGLATETGSSLSQRTSTSRTGGTGTTEEQTK